MLTRRSSKLLCRTEKQIPVILTRIPSGILWEIIINEYLSIADYARLYYVISVNPALFNFIQVNNTFSSQSSLHFLIDIVDIQ